MTAFWVSSLELLAAIIADVGAKGPPPLHAASLSYCNDGSVRAVAYIDPSRLDLEISFLPMTRVTSEGLSEAALALMLAHPVRLVRVLTDRAIAWVPTATLLSGDSLDWAAQTLHDLEVDRCDW